MIRSALFLFLVILSQLASAQDLHEEAGEYRRKFTESERRRVDTETEQGELRARLRQLPRDSAESSQVKAELEKGKLVIGEIEAVQKAVRERLHELQNRPEYRIPLEMKGDRRRPTKKNIGGRWSAYFGLTGYQLQLEQRGEVVTGRGYHWGCTGIFGPFEVKGTYRNSILSLSYLEPTLKPEEYVFRYFEERGRPRFRSVNEKRVTQLTPQVDVLRELERENRRQSLQSSSVNTSEPNEN